MRSHARKLIRTALLCGVFALPNFAAQARTADADTLPGVWKITVTPDDSASQAGKNAFDDMLLFENGQMMASACSSYGFAETNYTLADGGASFSCTMSTDTESIVWQAQVQGSNLQGNVMWSKSDGNVYHYTFSGARSADSDESQDQQQQQQTQSGE